MKISPQVAAPDNGLDEASSAALVQQAGFSVPVCEQAPPGYDAPDVSLVVPANQA